MLPIVFQPVDIINCDVIDKLLNNFVWLIKDTVKINILSINLLECLKNETTAYLHETLCLYQI